MKDSSLKLSVTVVIPARDNSLELTTCLEHIHGFEKVVVVESGDVEAAKKIAEPFGAEVVPFVWNGKFPKKRNWLLRNYTLNTTWVLFLDTDEILTKAFIQELTICLPKATESGFLLNFTNQFMGKTLCYGDRFRKLALFRVGAGEYERIEEDSWSHLDMEVHEHPVLDGPVGEIKSPIEHRDFRGLRHWLDKHNAYSDWEANRYMKLMKDGKIVEDGLTKRQLTKYQNLTKWWFPAAYFFGSYVLKRGFLDGASGLRFSALKAYYFFLIQLKIKEKQSQDSN